MNDYDGIVRNSRTKYSDLQNTNNFDCGPSCLNRFNSERSNKDIWYYNLFVLNEPSATLPPNGNKLEKWNNTPSKKEPFKKCICSSRQGSTEICQDTDLVENSYAKGTITESTDLKSPGWNRGPNPGSYDFPKSCGGAPFRQHPNFGPWSEDTLFN